MNATQLEREFAGRGVLHAGGLLLLGSDDALALVARAAEERVPVLGIDGMFVAPTGTESPVEHIADYSAAVAAGDGCWQQAAAFIRARASLGLIFEVTLGDDRVAAV